MSKPKLVFVASEPPMPPKGGGNRTFHCARAVAEVSYSHLFILFPINVKELPAIITSSFIAVKTSTKKSDFTFKSKFRLIIYYLKLIFVPWSFTKKEIIVTADYYVNNIYHGNSFSKRIFFILLRFILTIYAIALYQLGYALPVKTLERIDQYQELKNKIAKEMELSDMAWIDFTSLLPFFKNIHKSFPKIKVICNAHNIEYKNLERLTEVANDWIEKWWYRCQASVMKRCELEGLKFCDLIFTCSEIDKLEIIKFLPNANVEVLSNGVDLDFFKPFKKLTSYPTILFTGTMGYKANKDAVEHFVLNIYPIILRKYPECKFTVAGAGANEALKYIKNINGLQVISSPRDMRPVYDRSWVVVVPLTSGSGTRLKILEALAMEKPVVSTALGAEGLSIVGGVDLLIADDNISFAECVCELLSNVKNSDVLAQAGSLKVKELYSWERIRLNTSARVLQLYSGMEIKR
jgi:polysaccharide biosynthesis protein PslH